MAKNRKRKKAGANRIIIPILLLVLACAAMLGIVLKRYAPTRERMDLTAYFEQSVEDESSVILNGVYMEVEADSAVYAVHKEQGDYLLLSFVKNNLDDGYSYDSTEQILRYATDQDVISVDFGSANYYVNKDAVSLSAPILLEEYDHIYVSVEFLEQFTDISSYTVAAPNRIVIETAGWEHDIATVRRHTEARRFGGNKSKILADVEKDDSVIIMENYGKWSLVLTDQGVLGCIRNNKLKSKENVVTEARLPERTYNHISLDKKISMGWHQVTNQTANGRLEEVLGNTSGINVMSPTWFCLNDNAGGVRNLCSSEYVEYCHARGIQVWALVSNVEVASVDTAVVLNTTSSRDALVNNLIASAITYNLDGINVDIEALPASAKDGYIAFIRELSIKCEKNNLVLSVDNYPPGPNTMIYNRAEQAKYADYVVIMGYDEHYGGDDEPGSVASIEFVKNAVADTMLEVPAEQIVLGMPFYCRLWAYDAQGTLTSKSLGMDRVTEYISEKGFAMTWDEELGQYYGEQQRDGKTYMLWQEEKDSLSLKLQVMQDNHLAGAAYWKLGLEPVSIWSTIGSYIN